VSALPKAVSQAGRSVGLNKRISCQTFRHSFDAPLLQQGDEIRTVQKQLGHNDVKTTMGYTHGLTRGRLAVRSPWIKEAALVICPLSLRHDGPTFRGMPNQYEFHARYTRDGGPACPRQADQRRRFGELVDACDEIPQVNAQETIEARGMSVLVQVQLK
jgi:hypothetical protein